MNSNDLTYAQARQIHHALFPLVNYLVRLRNRMNARGFPPTDELFIEVEHAYDAACRLSNMAHRLSCKGMGRPEKSLSSGE
jgi:hypothetical protein